MEWKMGDTPAPSRSVIHLVCIPKYICLSIEIDIIHYRVPKIMIDIRFKCSIWSTKIKLLSEKTDYQMRRLDFEFFTFFVGLEVILRIKNLCHIRLL